MNDSVRRLRIAAALLVGILCAGSLGYALIEDFTALEAFYMTIITVSTVGFGEVRELSDSGKLFTAGLILSSIGTFTFAATAVTRFFVEGNYRDRLRARRIEKIMNEKNNHIIVCGNGRVGEKAVQELEDHKQDVVIVEWNTDLVDKLRKAGKSVLAGDATEDENLINAGLDRAQALITTLPDDAQNLYVVLAARERRKDLLIISRASNANAVSKLRVAGAQNVIMPDQVGGAHMASLVAIPDVVEFLDHIRIQGADAVNLEEIEVRQLPDRLQSMTLAEIDARNRIGVNVIGLRKVSGEMVINPPAETPLESTMKLFVLGTSDQIRRLNEFIGIQSPSLH
ncbi:MAG: potassium channel protein [Bacteroidetes bacterium]|nr:potassium channel protein [Bacteroidota bacterium]MDA1335251.1 potassium channel protein [Bacteroidota bacterium]